MEQRRQPVSAMCICGPMQCTGDPYETPRHSNLDANKKIVRFNNFGCRWDRFARLQHHVRATCMSCLTQCILRLDMRHPDIRTCRDDAKICPNNFVRIWRWVRMEQPRHPVSVKCLCNQRRCIAQPVKTPRHSNLTEFEKICPSKRFRIQRWVRMGQP